MSKPKVLEPDKYYSVDTEGNHLEVEPQEPDVWVCRRQADFPDGKLPPHVLAGVCTQCFEPIGYGNEAWTAPKVCFQCEGYIPLPMGVKA